MQDEFVEHLQKRIRNLQKRKQRLDRYSELVEKDPKSLNSDQLAALQNKDSVEAPLKELSDVLSLYKEADASREEKQLASIKQAAEKAREEATALARDQLRTVTKFLFLAAYRHQDETSDRNELEAVDTLLQKLYVGTEDALETADKLFEGKSEKVHGDYSYAQLKEWAIATAREHAEDAQAEQVETDEEPQTQTTEEKSEKATKTEQNKPDAEQEAKKQPKSGKPNRSNSPNTKAREDSPRRDKGRNDQQKPGATASAGDKKNGHNRRKKPQGGQGQKQTTKAT